MEYPQPLPELDYKTVQFETGFYPTAVVALENGWSLIKRCLITHSTKIAIKFFSEHFWLLERFRNVETKKINLSILRQHTHEIMSVFERLIESGLNDVTSVNMILSDVKNKHKIYGITLADIKMINQCIIHYLLDFLVKVNSATFKNGLNKLSELIIEHHMENTAGDDLIDLTK